MRSAPIDPDMHLLLDDRIIERVDNARLRVGPVVKHPANPLFGEEYDWEVQFNNLYPNVIYDTAEQLYKIWYFTYTYDPAYARTPPEERRPGSYIELARKAKAELGIPPGDDPRTDGLGYAVSQDGIRWTKPMMDICPWEGRPSNLMMAPAHGVGVIKDLEEKDPAQRYKMVCQMGMNVMGVAFSSDGVHWGEVIPTPEIEAAGDTHNNALWVPELNRYVTMTRLWDDQRLVGRAESRDFIHWTKAVEVLRGTRQKQTYAMPIFRYANVYLGFPAIVDLETDRTQTELAWSPDTIAWHRIDPGTPLIPNGEQPGDCDWGIIHASRPVFRDDEIRIHYGGCDGRHSFDWRKGYLCLATLPPDRFAGYEPAETDRPASVLTRPVDLDGELRITADAGGGSLRVSVLDEPGNVLCVSENVTEDVTREPAPWRKGSPLHEFVGRTVRLRFEVEKARVFAFRVSSHGA